MSREVMKLALETLEANRQTHHYCEDTWYSCPKHEEGCANELEGDECICGADKANFQFDYAILALRKAIEEGEKQEPVATIQTWHKMGEQYAGLWDWHFGLEKLPDGEHYLYTSPPRRQPLTDEWVPVTQKLLNEQHPWLYEPMWIAMKGGVVVQGYYEWRQGRNPDRFITDLGDEWAFNADCVMPITKPTPPAIEAAHGIGDKT